MVKSNMGYIIGKNDSKSPIFSISYELKVIITYGKYRKEALEHTFNDFDIYMIGPRIAYADTDTVYKEHLLKQMSGKKVATLFPAHSIWEAHASYDAKYFLNKAREIAHGVGIDNIRVCLRQEDIENGNGDEFFKQGIDVVSANSAWPNDAIHFLPKLRAIIETSSLMITNSIGTHIGYGLYFNVPQILVSQKNFFL